MRYELARDSDARAGGLRVSAIRTRSLRCVAVTVALLVYSLLCPVNAYADQWSSVWHHSSFLGGEQYIVGAYNKYAAAAYICGYSKSDVQSWDLTVLNKLSTHQTAFSDLADSLENVTPWQDDTLSSTLRNYFGDALWALMTSIHLDFDAGLGVNPFGLSIFQISYWNENRPSDMSVWAVNTTSTAVNDARAAVELILSGGGGAGGSQPDANGDFALELYGQVYNQRAIVDSGSSILKLYGNSKTYYDNHKDEYPYVYVSISGYVNDQTSTRYNYGSFFMTDKPASFTTSTSTSGSNKYDGVSNQWVMVYQRTVQIDFQSDATVKYMTITTNNENWNSAIPTEFSCNASVYDYTGDFTNTITGGFFILSQNAGGGDEPTGPGDWPDDPSPEPPESPTVPTPTPPEQPTPYTPITPPTIPPEITTNVTDPASWTDYTPWLQQILQQLRNLNDALTEHCVHIQQQIVNQSTNIINALNAANEDMKDYLYELQRGLTGYLKQLFDWLADQFDFESNSYNDSSVLYWLRQIYDKLGKLIRTNVPTVLEPDPTEPFDFWAWLWGLITNVIGGFIGDFVDGVDGLIDGIKDKFPFSIPWDIAAMLALLSANRVTPVFDITIPAVNGWWDSYHYRVDLQPYDAVASVCRSMFLILWAFVLLMKTNWMLDLMGSATGLGERFASRVGRGTE